MLLVILVGLFLAAVLCPRAYARPRFNRRPMKQRAESHGFGRKKPKWVPSAVIRLCALMPHAGCRQIAHTFNRQQAGKGESVGKTYVASLAKRRALAILSLRRKLKNRAAKQGPRNLTWAADLTFLPDSFPALGILDHGTRALITFRAMQTRTTIAILRVVLDAVEAFGTPRFFRTDNEPVFASPVFSLALRLLGIRHRRTDRFCPWQNGRIERVFWTLKERVVRWWTEKVFLRIRSPISTSSASGTTTPGLTWAWRAKHLSKHGIPWPVDNSAISRRGMDCSPVSGGQLEVCAVFPSSSADSTPYVYELARTAVNRPVFRANSSVAWVVSGLRCVRTRQIRRVRVHLEGCGRRGQDTGNESLSRRPWEGGGRSQRRTAERK